MSSFFFFAIAYVGALSRAISAVSLSTLHGIAHAFSLCDPNSRSLFPPVAELLVVLASSGESDAWKFCEALQRVYYMAYVAAHWRAHGMSSVVQNSWNAMLQNHTDGLAVRFAEMTTDAAVVGLLCQRLLLLLTRQPHSAVLSLQVS